MAKLALGILCSLIFGGLAVATMIPLAFSDKRGMLGAFFNRFAIGVVLGIAALPLTGLLFGLLLSLPDAIITKAYAPIIGVVVAA